MAEGDGLLIEKRFFAHFSPFSETYIHLVSIGDFQFCLCPMFGKFFSILPKKEVLYRWQYQITAFSFFSFLDS